MSDAIQTSGDIPRQLVRAEGVSLDDWRRFIPDEAQPLPPAEGKLHVRRGDSVHVGKRVRVKLLATDVERGHIDFELLS